jgi:hypothetical protein
VHLDLHCMDRRPIKRSQAARAVVRMRRRHIVALRYGEPCRLRAVRWCCALFKCSERCRAALSAIAQGLLHGPVPAIGCRPTDLLERLLVCDAQNVVRTAQLVVRDNLSDRQCEQCSLRGAKARTALRSTTNLALVGLIRSRRSVGLFVCLLASLLVRDMACRSARLGAARPPLVP